jgi:putative oxidoreductase
MFKKLVQTNDDFVMLFLRVMLGIVYIPHGLQKILTFSGTMQMFTVNLHIPWVFALLAIMAEFLGSWGLITGLLTRVAAFGIAVDMAVAVYMLHWQNGFFMNWFGNQKGEGFEFHILAIAIAIALMIRGGGLWSVDRAISKKK